MRRLVYRVKELPPSMFPLIWDFGTLNDATENKYISQMIVTRIQQKKLQPNDDHRLLLDVLCRSQSFMRERKDECSFVSLRDVERMLMILDWLEMPQNKQIITERVHGKFYGRSKSYFMTNLILALGVSYYVRLDERRKEYAKEMSRLFALKDSTFIDIIVASQVSMLFFFLYN